MTEEQIVALAMEHEVLFSMDLVMGLHKGRVLKFAEAIRKQAFEDLVRHFDEKAAKMEETARILGVEGSDDIAVQEYMGYAAEYLAAASMVSVFAQSAI